MPSPVSLPALRVRFLGVGGFLIEGCWEENGGVRRESVMTAPMYSNPTLGELAWQEFHPDHELIDQLLPRDEVRDVLAILSGHAHHDHLMDAPHVALHDARRARLYGNDAMLDLLAPLIHRHGLKACSLEPKQGDDCRSVSVGSRFHIHAIRSEHSSQIRFAFPFGGLPDVRLWRGDVYGERRTPPSRGGEWVQGTTLSFVIEFEAGLAAPFRIYYQDSATRPPIGHPCRCFEGVPIDLALLCVGASETVEHFPDELLREIQPDFVMGSHWEDFFNPRQRPPPGDAPPGTRPDAAERIHAAPLQNPERVMRRVRRALPPSSRSCLPCPDAVAVFEWGMGSRWELGETTERWRPGEGPATS